MVIYYGSNRKLIQFPSMILFLHVPMKCLWSPRLLLCPLLTLYAPSGQFYQLLWLQLVICRLEILSSSTPRQKSALLETSRLEAGSMKGGQGRSVMPVEQLRSRGSAPANVGDLRTEAASASLGLRFPSAGLGGWLARGTTWDQGDHLLGREDWAFPGVFETTVSFAKNLEGGKM